MKTTIIAASVLLAQCALPALADGTTKTLGGCALIDKGGYSVKADPTCEFTWANDDGEDRDLIDHDNDPSTPSVRG